MVFENHHNHPEDVRTQVHTGSQPGAPLIVGAGIYRIFGENDLATEVLRGINITVRSGEFVAIMGRSGAGKSTLLYQLSGLDQPTRGSIMIDGVDITKLNQKELSAFRLHELGFVFQDYALIPDLTAHENVILPLLMSGTEWTEATAIADSALAAVGLEGKHTKLPAQLSGGEQQRVSIARAVAGRPKIIFADEPTANLDSASGDAVVALLTELHRNGQTIVMVTHEEEYARGCDRIIFLTDGRVVTERTKPKVETVVARDTINPYFAVTEKNSPPTPTL